MTPSATQSTKAMPVCVHCGAPTRALYVSYGPRHIVCTRCKACGAFADPYVEHEAFIVGIDLVCGSQCLMFDSRLSDQLNHQTDSRQTTCVPPSLIQYECGTFAA